MSWEDQGRQERGRFGHGNSGVDEGGSSRVLTAAEADALVVRGAAAFLDGGQREGFERFLGGGGAGLLTGAMPGWAAASGLDKGRFRALMVGGRAGAGVARALQATGAAVREARDVEGLRVASASLAAAVREGGAEWRYALRSARDQVVHVMQLGLVWSDPALPDAGQHAASLSADRRGAYRGGDKASAGRQQNGGIRTISDESGIPPGATGPLRRLQGLPQEEEARRGVLRGGPREGRFPRTGAVTPQQATDLLPKGMTAAQFGEIAGLGRAVGVEAGMAAEITASETAAAVARLKASGVTKEAVAAWLELYGGMGNNGSAALRVRQLRSILEAY